MMGGLDTAVGVVPRERLNHDNGPPYFQPSSPSRDSVLINNYGTVTVCLTTAAAGSAAALH